MREIDISIKISNAIKKIEKSFENETDKGKVIRNNRNSYMYTTKDGKQCSTVDRVVPEVKKPETKIPIYSEIFNKDGIPDYKFLMNHFRKQGRISEKHVLNILDKAEELMSEEDNLILIEANEEIPIAIVGDIHGQYYDLLEIIKVCGEIKKDCKYLFLGDYVDRGDWSLEVLLLVYAMKLSFPNEVTLLRGNHESRRMSEYFTFRRECERRYSKQVWISAVSSFRALPLGAIVNGDFLCVHAGISSKLDKLSDIVEINRFKVDVPSKGLMCDLVWSDPIDNYDEEEDSEEDDEELFTFNSARRCSELYSFKAVEKFLKRNDLLAIVRGHQPQMDGYRLHRTGDSGFPTVITIFSAANYCGTYGNLGAAIIYDGGQLDVKQIKSQDGPYCLRDQMDVFSWSLPFVAEKVSELVASVLNVCIEDEVIDNKSYGWEIAAEQWRKIRSEREAEIKEVNTNDDDNDESPREEFESVRAADIDNEGLPSEIV